MNQPAQKRDDTVPEIRSSILIVDDIPTNRSVLNSLLSKPGSEVVEASNGRQALDLIEKRPFDLVILDILMPGLSGIEVLELVRKRFSSDELPVLMLTVKDDADDVVKALETGANDYVTRPIDYTVLTTRIEALLSYKQTQDSIRESQSLLEDRIAERTQELVRANQALQAEILEKKQAEQRLRVSQQRYQMLYNDTPSMFFTLSGEGRVLSANKFGADYLGYDVEAIVNKRFVDHHRESDHPLIEGNLRNCIQTPGNVHRWEACMLHSDGSQIWVRTAARVMSSDAQVGSSILVVCEDITEAYTLSEQLKYQAKYDALTGLVNRYELEDRLELLLRDSRRNRTQHALLYLDLDQFKVINDTCGHGAGDELLRQLGKMLRKYIAPDNTLARLGGDEFAVLLCDCDLDEAADTAETLHRAIREFRFTWRDTSFGIGVSIGVVAIEHTIEDISTLLSAADTACYAAKEEGPKHVHVYKPDDKEVVRRYREMAWISKIDKALEEQRFELFYQRIVPISSDKTSLNAANRFELLLRMRDEDGNLVRPGSFLPAAERYKYATRLDSWVVDHALTWLSQSPQILEGLSMCSINLSGHSVSDNDFLSILRERLQSSSVPPAKLCFELTETATIANLVNATELMEELRSKGCCFALDDFGTGLSSFEYLKNLPVDFIKIDGQFIRNVVADPIDNTMVRSINEIAKVMSKQTIAEFVDSASTLATLRDIGIDFAQGNAIAIPKPISKLVP